MRRRGFLKSASAAATISLIPEYVGKTEDVEEWSMRSAWYYHNDYGKCVLYESGELEHHFRYSEYDMWRRSSLVNSDFIDGSVIMPVHSENFSLWRFNMGSHFYQKNFCNHQEDISIAVIYSKMTQKYKAAILDHNSNKIIDIESRDVDVLSFKLNKTVEDLLHSS